MVPEISSLRYILFLIDSKIKEHDGKIYVSYQDAKDYAIDCLQSHYADKVVIGMFSLDAMAEHMQITKVETIGFAGDKKNIHQIALFNGR
jgi:hypothetical protein